MTARHLRRSILAADLLWVVLAMLLAYLFRYGWVWHRPSDNSALVFVPPLVASLLLWCVISSWVSLDGFGSRWLFSAVLSKLLLAVAAMMSSLLALAYLMQHFVSRLTLGYFGHLLLAGLVAIRLIARSVLFTSRTRGLFRKVVVVGKGPLAREMIRKIEDHPEMLREIVGFLTPGEEPFLDLTSGPRNGALTVQGVDVAEMLAARGVEEVVLTLAASSQPEILDLTARCTRRGIAVSMVPQPYELYVIRHELNDIDGIPLLQLLPVSSAETQPMWKRGFDVLTTLALLPVCLPPMLAGAVVLKIKKGRAFCTERRCGKNGREFDIFRLNSSRRGTDLPPYERLLEKLSITELPQLFNVLRGEMSLVGPRPEGLDRAYRYTDWHHQRLRANPGITGLAQVYGLRDEHSTEDKTRYDLQYILHQTLLQDVSLLLQTGWTLTLRLFRRQEQQSPANHQVSEEAGSSFQENLIHAHSSQSSAN